MANTIGAQPGGIILDQNGLYILDHTGDRISDTWGTQVAITGTSPRTGTLAVAAGSPAVAITGTMPRVGTLAAVSGPPLVRLGNWQYPITGLVLALRTTDAGTLTLDTGRPVGTAFGATFGTGTFGTGIFGGVTYAPLAVLTLVTSDTGTLTLTPGI